MRNPVRSPVRRLARVLVAVAVVSIASAAAPAVAAGPPSYLSPPVDAPVIDPFRAPATSFGPGNRGLEYDTELGQPVSAAAGGVVVFAGAVARTLHVTIDHGAGMLSSYSFLDRILVARGDVVARHERVGVAGETFHFGVRIDGHYVDPAALMGVVRVRVRLVPTRGGPPAVPLVSTTHPSFAAAGGSAAATEPSRRDSRPGGRATTWYAVVAAWYSLLRR